MTLLSGAAHGTILFENPYYDGPGLGPGGGAMIQGCNPCSAATPIFLSNASTIQAVSFTVQDLFAAPENAYTWSIYKDVNGIPSGTPLDSGQSAINASQGVANIYSYVQLAPPINGSNAIDEVTIKTGPVTLGAGNYFFAITASGLGDTPETWMSGTLNDAGTPAYTPPISVAISDAITVYGTSAPEIDPSSAMSGLTLLFGGLAVLRGRRPVKLERRHT